MVKTLPIPSYGGSGAGAIRLVQRQVNYRSGDEVEAPRDTDTKRAKSQIAFLDPEQLNASVANCILAANPILKVEPVSFFLGATSTLKPRSRGEWEYRPQWVFLDAAKARKTMEATYSTTQRVLVFRLPALVFYMADVLLLVAELNTNEPFRSTFEKLKRAREYDATDPTQEAQFKKGLFCPKTLRDTVEFFLARTTAARKKSWLFALASPPSGRKKGGVFPPPALVYTIASRGQAQEPTPRNPAGTVNRADLRWRQRTLGTPDEPKMKTRDAPVKAAQPTHPVRGLPEEPMGKYVRQLLALTFP